MDTPLWREHIPKNFEFSQFMGSHTHTPVKTKVKYSEALPREISL